MRSIRFLPALAALVVLAFLATPAQARGGGGHASGHSSHYFGLSFPRTGNASHWPRAKATPKPHKPGFKWPWSH